jgi:putative ABC transport system permease protein
MESFVHELAVKKVLSIEDIILLKKYIANKHKDYSTSQKSEVLAAAVHQILDKNIPDIKHHHRQNIKHTLLENAISNTNKPILLVDIFNTCISMEDKSSDFFDGMTDWVNFHVENKVSKIELQRYEYKTNVIYNKESIRAIDKEEEGSTVTVTVTVTAADDATNYPEPVVATMLYSNSIKKANFILGIKNTLNTKMLRYSLYFLVAFSLAFFNQYNMEHPFILGDIFGEKVPSQVSTITSQISLGTPLAQRLPNNFTFKDINENQLKKFLIEKNSLLAEEEYFNTIISVSKNYNINPLILFAIAGQEQGFVSKQMPSSKKIVNNPFDVYHSWRSYNTNLEDACRITCTTIINLCKDRPLDYDPFSWIGKTYAEDPNWSNGVNLIYKNLESIDAGS